MQYEQTVKFARRSFEVAAQQNNTVNSDLNRKEQYKLIYGANMLRTKFTEVVLDQAKDFKQKCWNVFKSDFRDVC